jgi:hypothetical protein
VGPDLHEPCLRFCAAPTLAISKQSAMDLLKPLLAAGLIERAGTLKHGRYMLKNPPSFRAR